MPSTVAISYTGYGNLLNKLFTLPVLKYRKVDEDEEYHYAFYSPKDASLLYDLLMCALAIPGDVHFHVDPMDILKLKFLLQGGRTLGSTFVDPQVTLVNILSNMQKQTSGPHVVTRETEGGW